MMHLISDVERQCFLIYLPDTLNVIRLDEFTYRAVEKYLNGKTSEQVCQELAIDPYDFKEFLDYIQRVNGSEPKESKKLPNRIVSRITLHIANDCNLRCKYCYADGGSYSTTKGLMTLDTANSFLRFIKDNFDFVGCIVFFGGEPMLNTSVIEQVCSSLTNMYDRKEILFLPSFGIITNGTIQSPKIWSLLKQYFSFVTVSIDGDETCHNLNRIDLNGKGTYHKVAQFISQATKFGNLTVNYEATYTKEHIALGLTREMISSYIKEQFSIEGIVMDEFSMEKENFERGDALDHTSDSYLEGFESVATALITKQPKTMCRVYRNIFSVSTEGDIYPCHMNTGNEKCSLGNISLNNIFNSPKEYFTRYPYLLHEVKDNPTCSACWANKICGGCTKLWFYDEKLGEYRMTPNLQLCTANKTHLEKIILKIATTLQ